MLACSFPFQGCSVASQGLNTEPLVIVGGELMQVRFQPKAQQQEPVMVHINYHPGNDGGRSVFVCKGPATYLFKRATEWCGAEMLNALSLLEKFPSQHQCPPPLPPPWCRQAAADAGSDRVLHPGERGSTGALP